MIHDLSMELIGTGLKRDGLYFFGGVASVQHVSVTGESCKVASSC